MTEFEERCLRQAWKHSLKVVVCGGFAVILGIKGLLNPPPQLADPDLPGELIVFGAILLVAGFVVRSRLAVKLGTRG